jgi:hypothetical protein
VEGLVVVGVGVPERAVVHFMRARHG